MTRVLVVWEDYYFTTIGPFVKKRVSARAPAGQHQFPEVLFHTSHGNGSFNRYVASTWENVRAKGLPGNPGLIEHLICVVDGDKLHDQLDSVVPPPVKESDLPAWHAGAEQAWQAHLQSLCQSAPASSVHGRVLRWAKESLVLAGYDRDAFLQHLGIDLRSAAVKEHLVRCSPAPSSIEDAAFSSTFRRPLRCVTDMDGAQRGPRPAVIGKNAPEIDDALRALARDDCTLVAARVPDIDRIADLIWQLAAAPPASPSAGTPSPAAGTAPAGTKKPPPKKRWRPEH